MQVKVILQPTIMLPVAGALIALALADGGFSSQSVGVATAAIWLLLAGAVTGGWLRLGDLAGPLAAGAALLALIAAWTALSIGWAGDDGAAFADLVRALMYLGAFLLVGLSARRGSGPSWLAGIALGGSAVAVIAVLARLAGLGVDQALAVEIPAAAERLSFPLGYWNALGYLMAMTLVAQGWVAVNAPGQLGRFAAAASVPVVLALFLTSSRGALLAAVIGLVLLGWACARRERLWQVTVAVVPVWVLLVGITAVLRSDLDPFAGVTVAGVLIAAALAASFAFVYVVLDGSHAHGGGLRSWLGAHARPILAAVVIGAVAVGVLAGPSSFIGDFRTERGGGEIATTTDALVSGSGRSEFWGAALSAFGEDPVRGLGAGGFENYWNANGDIQVPIRNAHSAPLETLAELGLVGGLALLGLLAVAVGGLVGSARASRAGHRGMLGAFAGIGAAGVVAVSLDWTWQMTASAAPLLIVIAVACAAALRPDRDGREITGPQEASRADTERPQPTAGRAQRRSARGRDARRGLGRVRPGPHRGPARQKRVATGTGRSPGRREGRAVGDPAATLERRAKPGAGHGRADRVQPGGRAPQGGGGGPSVAR